MKIHSLLCLITLFFSSIIDGATPRFVSKSDGFSIQPPNFIQRAKIHKKRTDQDLLVTMGDDFGTLFSIEHFKMSIEMEQQIEETSLTTFLTTFFEVTEINTIKKLLPGAQIVKKSTIELKNGLVGMYYLCDFPNSSLLQSSFAKEPSNSLRGHLLFLVNDHLMVLAYQTDQTIMMSEIDSDIEKVSERYLNHLVKAAETFEEYTR